MKTYTPMKHQNAAEWREFSHSGHQERISNFLKKQGYAGEELIRETLMHLSVENQLASGGKQVNEILNRLIAGGLDRQQALRRIGQVYWKFETELPRPNPDSIDFESFFQELEKL